MKQCPACNRKYSDETLNFCLDDGAALIYGPAESTAATADLTGQRFDSDAVTEILFPPRPSDGGRAAITEPDRSSGIKPQNRDWALGAGLAILVLAGFLSFRHFYSAEADATGPAAPAAEPSASRVAVRVRERRAP